MILSKTSSMIEVKKHLLKEASFMNIGVKALNAIHLDFSGYSGIFSNTGVGMVDINNMLFCMSDVKSIIQFNQGQFCILVVLHDGVNPDFVQKSLKESLDKLFSEMFEVLV